MDTSAKHHLTGTVFWVLVSWVVLPLVLVWGVLPFKAVQTTSAHWVFQWNDNQGWVRQGSMPDSQEDFSHIEVKDGYWVVQVATFQDIKRAKFLQSELREKGFQSTIFELPKQGRTLFALRVGPMDNKLKAQSQLESLQQKMGLMPMLMFISTQSGGV